MLLELASHSDGFSVSVSEMAQRTGCTRGRVQSALNTALKSRYLARKEYRTTRGHAYYEYWVRTDRPFTAEELASINVTVYLPDVAESPSVAPESLGYTELADWGIEAVQSVPDTSNDHVDGDSPVCPLCTQNVTDDTWSNGKGTWHLHCLKRARPNVDWTDDENATTKA